MNLDIEKIMILIVGKSENEIEWIEKEEGLNRYIFYYRKLGQRKEGIFSKNIMFYDTRAPFILMKNGYIYYESLSFTMDKTKEAMLFIPESRNQFQKEFLNNFPFEKIPYLKKIFENENKIKEKELNKCCK